MCMAVLLREVQKAPYCFISLGPFCTTKGPNILRPKNKKRLSSPILSLCRPVIFCCWNLRLRSLLLTHFHIIDLTTMFSPMTNPKMKQSDLINFYASTSMCSLIMTSTDYQIYDFPSLWQWHWMLDFLVNWIFSYPTANF